MTAVHSRCTSAQARTRADEVRGMVIQFKRSEIIVFTRTRQTRIASKSLRRTKKNTVQALQLLFCNRCALVVDHVIVDSFNQKFQYHNNDDHVWLYSGARCFKMFDLKQSTVWSIYRFNFYSSVFHMFNHVTMPSRGPTTSPTSPHCPRRLPFQAAAAAIAAATGRRWGRKGAWLVAWYIRI